MPQTFKFHRKIEIKHYHVLINSVGITDNNQLILCICSSTILMLYSGMGKHSQNCALNGKPWAITVIPGEDKAAVILPDQKSIQFVNIKTMTPGSTHSFPGQCYGVTIVSDNIYVGGYGGYLHILYIYSISKG